MVVDVGVAHAAAVEVERVIEQRAVAVRRGFQLCEELGEQRDVELVDLRHLGDFLRIVAVVGKRVMRIGDADFRVGAVAGFAGELEGDDAGDVALQGQHLQVEHQPGVVGVGGGHADGRSRSGSGFVRGVGFRFLDAAFDFANGVEILADLGAVGRAELLLQAGDVLGHPIEQAGSLAQRGAAFGGLPPSPNRRSKTMRGWASAGSGVVGEDQERLF